MWGILSQKLFKSELWVAIGGILAALIAPKLGVPVESLVELWTMIGGIVGAYIVGRSYAKPRELSAPVKTFPKP